MKKFAFSLVELTVVLLIIGLILAIALKGQIIIESARLRSEVRKIEKLQTSFANYVNRQNKLPPIISGTAAYDMQTLIDGKYISRGDAIAGIKTDNATSTYAWKYFACLNEREGGVDNYSWDIPQSNANLLLANVCVATADSADNQSVYMDGLLYCTIEVSLDDNRSLGGNGRLFKGSQSPGDYFDNCNLASGKPAQYLYKIW